jgi:hypothetical protein
MPHHRTSSAFPDVLAWTALAAAYFLATVLSHELVSGVYLGLAHWLGPSAADRGQNLLALLVLAAGVWLVAGPGRRNGRIQGHPGGRIGGRDALAWLALAGLLLAADRLLIIAPVERVHYPQYAILALLARRVLDDEALVLGLGGLAGMADELHQYLAHPANTTYLDWNDFCLNLLGVAAGLLLARALALRPLAGARAAARARAGFLALLVLLAGGVALAGAQGRIIAYSPADGLFTVFPRVEGKLGFVLSFFHADGFWNTAATGRSCHVLTPGEGLAAMFALFALLAGLLAWSRKSERPGSPQAPRPVFDRRSG